MGRTFILNDESVNRYGFRILNSGIDTTNFTKNPVALFMHQRASWTLPIGKWSNVRIEGSKLLADFEHDEDDEFAVKINKKVEKGILNACSMGFDPKETSSQDAVNGQSLETVTKCELLEVSIVDIPGNANSVKMDFHLAEGKNIDNLIPKINQNLNHFNMKKLALLFLMSETATEDEIAKKVEDLQKENADLKEENDTLKAEKGTAEKEALMAPHLANGTLKAEQKPSLLKMEVEDLKSFLGNMPTPTKTLSGQLGGGAASTDKRKDWSFDDYTKKDPEALLKMKTENPDQYKRLFEAQYDKA